MPCYMAMESPDTGVVRSPLNYLEDPDCQYILYLGGKKGGRQ